MSQDTKLFHLLPPFIKKRIEGRQSLQKILKNTGWLFFDKLLRMGVGLIVGVWVARYLGPSQYGSLNFAIAFTALFGALASLGLDGIVVRDIVRDPGRKFEIISTTFILKLCGGCVAFFSALAVITIMRPAESQTIWLVGIIAAGMIFQSFDAIDLWFQSQVQSKYTVLAKNGAFIIVAGVRIFLIVNKAPLVAFAYAVLIETTLGAFGLLILYLKQQTLFIWHPLISVAKKLLSESWPAILSGLSIMIYMRIDQIMLSQMINDTEVGIYSAALRFSEIWYMIPMIIVGSVMPALTQAKKTSEDLYRKRMQQLFNFLVRMAYLIALPFTFLSTFIVTFFYGNVYVGSGIILSIHIWTTVFVFLGVGMSPWILNEGLIRYSLIQTVAGAIANVVLNIFLIPHYGGVGAAISTLISQIIAAFGSNIAVPRLRVVFKMQLKALLKPF